MLRDAGAGRSHRGAAQRHVGRATIGWLFALAVFAASACAPVSLPSVGTRATAPTVIAPPPSVYVVGHGWHVGLAVRREDVTPDVWPEVVDLGRFTWIEVGWGDGDFYPTGSGTLALAVRAAFASATSVLHVAGFDRPVPQSFPEAPLVEVRLSQEALDRLSRFIHGTYARDDANRPIVVGPGLYADSLFYRARGTYRWWNNSNQWVARALRAAGCPLEPGLSINAGSVLAQVSRIGRVIRPPAAAGGPVPGPVSEQPDCA